MTGILQTLGGIGFLVMVVAWVFAIWNKLKKRPSKLWMITLGSSVLWLTAAAMAPNEKPVVAQSRAGAQTKAVGQNKTIATVRQAKKSRPTARPKPIDVHHDDRVKVSAWWDSILSHLAFSQIALDAAQESLKNGDMVAASGFIKQGAEQADAAKQATLKESPDGFNDINTELFGSAQGYQDSFDKFGQFLDDKKPSEGSEALSKGQEAASALTDATHEARVKYRDLGGDPMSLADLQTQHSVFKKLFESMGK